MNLLFDLKYALRLLNRSRGYWLMCASVVALSVGLAVWTWTVAYSQLFEPLGFPNSERWYSVQIAADAAARGRPSVDAYTWQQLAENKRSADYLGAFSSRDAVLSEGEATTSLRAAIVTPRLLAATRVAPLLGRTLADSEGQPGGGGVAVLSFDCWQRYFAADPAIIGKTARIDAAPVRIVGVMPKGFFLFQDYEVWLPMQLPRLAARDSSVNVSPIFLLHDKQNLSDVSSEMRTVVERVNADNPTLFNAARHVVLIPASRIYSHSAKPIVIMLALMSGAVLLLGGVNISMVFLARLLERSPELALRTALGAARSRIMRQCLLESALVVVVGLFGGYALAAVGVQWTHGIDSFSSRILADGRSSNLPTLRPFDLAVAVLAATAVWLLSTLIPAWKVSRQDAAVVLASNGKGAAGRGSNRSVGLLVGIQVVIACLVLVTCGSVVLAVDQEVKKPVGLNTAGVMLATYPTLLGARYSERAQRVRYWEDLEAALESKVPGVEAAFTTAPPTRPARVAATIETRQGADKQGMLTLPVTVVSDGYFKLMGVSLRAGRMFESADNNNSLKVAIVDEKMAARYWPDQNVLGKRVRLNSSASDGWLTIVGVVSAVRGAPYRTDADIGTLYQPLRQAAPAAFQLLVRMPDSSSDHRAALQAAAFGVDRDLPIHNLQWLDDYLAAINLQYPAMTRIFSVIALITAMLAASGLFGLISRSVAQRTQEVGVRRALGATSWRATSMFLRQGASYLSVAIVAVGLGILVVPLLSRPFPNILERVIPVTLGVVVLMAAVISTASYLPTRRAVALEPGDALRHE